jgi:putative membrane-bound dehydrogenase-like protein
MSSLSRTLVRVALSVAVSAILPIAPADSDEIQLASDAPRPLPPEESRRLFQLPEGLAIQLVASEPHVSDPVAIAFDAQGRILVCEIHGYNLEGYYDIVELNKAGKLDTEVRRIPATDEAVRRAEQQQYGTVKRLEDIDGDGLIDRSTVLADHLPPCYGVVPARDGVIVLCAPDIVYLADRDNDGKAEVRETLFTGFGTGELWTRINNPRWGVDNWIYAVSGAASAGTITGPRLDKPVELGSVCFRFRADGTAIEPAGGRTHGFGQAVNDWGDRFLCTNQQHAMHVIPIPYRYLTRNPYYAAPALTKNISTYGHPAPVYPTSAPDPWRRARAADPAWVRFYGEAEATANGYFTAASGQTIYQGELLPEEYHGNHFSVDNAQNLIHRCMLEPDGVTYGARRPREDEETEFLASAEQWFRPVNLTTGPDGGLYVVDMYRDIIEDYSAIPRHLQQVYVESLIAGADRGRIWRIVPGEAARRSSLDLSKATADELVECLASPNAWRRKAVQRLLIERGENASTASLERMAAQGPTSNARLHALYSLEGIGTLRPAAIEQALHDSHFAVRMHGLRLAEDFLCQDSELIGAILELVDDKHARIRLQLALTLGEANDPRAASTLAGLASEAFDDPWMSAAILCSSANSSATMLAAILAKNSDGFENRTIVHSLASVAGASGDRSQIMSVLTSLAGFPHDGPIEVPRSVLAGLSEGLDRAGKKLVGTSEMVAPIRRLLHRPDEETRRLTVHVASTLDLLDLPEMQAVFAESHDQVADEDQSIEERTAALLLLSSAPLDRWETLAATLLEPQQPLDLQLAAVQALGPRDEKQVPAMLLAGFRSYTPAVRTAVIDAIFQRNERLETLVEAIENESVPVSGIDAIRREQLLRQSRLSERVQALLADRGGETGRQKVLAIYQQALNLPRDAQLGKKVFEQHCQKCHKLGTEGFEVGPDLLTARTRADETLISDVMDPSNQITIGYDNYTVITVDGRIYTGVLSEETATSIALKKEEAVRDVILRKNIDEMEASRLSMMPENLEELVSPQDLAHLLGFLRNTIGSASPSVATLFDDESEFPVLLSEGEGLARIDASDPYSGKVALVVSPPQRFSATIPGWEFPIREDPGSGEYRYLRYAWKLRTGHGVMLELADGGHWPAADAPRQRYFAGRNTTGWAAICVDEATPVEWTVVQRDLWADFGNFTLTGLAPTAMGGEVLFDRIELLQSLEP